MVIPYKDGRLDCPDPDNVDDSLLPACRTPKAVDVLLAAFPSLNVSESVALMGKSSLLQLHAFLLSGYGCHCVPLDYVFDHDSATFF